jgi:hypothetical protein
LGPESHRTWERRFADASDLVASKLRFLLQTRVTIYLTHQGDEQDEKASKLKR